MSLTVLVGAMIFSYAFVRGANSFVKGGCKLERRLLFEGMRDRLGDASFFGFVFGISLAISGWPGFAALSTVVFTAALVAASNAKHILLQEPLVFTDFVLLKCVVKHPTFYMFAIGIRLRLAIVLGLILMIGLLGWSLVSAPLIGHVTGLILIIFFLTVLRVLPVQKIAPEPDLARDVSRLGLGGCLALYWQRWLQQAPCPVPALPSPAKAEPGEICIVVQCESFAEPARLGLPQSFALPELHELNAARARASQYGRLDVSVFGAYTLRTEYAVLSGRGESELGFCRYDPFLSALGEADKTLPSLLNDAGFHSIYVHPNDLDFADRAVYMPGLGFTESIGIEGFSSQTANKGVRVSDLALAEFILDAVDRHVDPLFIYAVTIENHGPWSGHGDPGERYLSNLTKSDAMIGALVRGLDARGRPARLIFFGDHRPSIPGLISSDAGRDTPYVIVDFAKGEIASRSCNIPPEALFEAALRR